MKLRLEHLPADVFGLTDIARAALRGRPRPPELGGLLVPNSIDSVPTPAERLEPDARALLAKLLERELARHEPHVAVIDGVRALARPGTTLVLAGQQPGLLGGPLYDAYKALHVIRLARALSEAWETPVLPAFWNHGDDHDVAEVHHLWIQNPNLDLRKVGLAGVSSGRVPLSRIVFDSERHRLDALGELLRQNLAGGAPREEELRRFLPRTGESFSSSFTRVMLDLFGAHGLIVIEPDWIRTELSRSLAAVVTTDLVGALRAGSEALERAGLAPPIEPDSSALVYHLIEGRRRALRAAPGGFRYDDEPGSRTAAELAAEIVQEPDAWSPGALLRPVVQDLVLPTAAYVGGWGELGYLAQLGALRERVGAPSVPFVPRFSATVVEPETDAALARLGCGVADVLAGRVEVAEAPEPAVVRALRELAGETAARVLESKEGLAALDPGLAAQGKRAAGIVRDALESLAGKAERVHRNRSGTGERHLRRVQNALLPRGEPQERVRGTLELVTRHGTDWLARLLEEIEPLPVEHVAVHLEEDGPSER